jgi:hypothetical protein
MLNSKMFKNKKKSHFENVSGIICGDHIKCPPPIKKKKKVKNVFKKIKKKRCKSIKKKNREGT